MAKKASKKAKASKSTSRSARRSPRRATSARQGRANAKSATRGGVDLKKLKTQLGLALAHVRRAPAREFAAAPAGMDTATRLERMMADIEDICASGDCGEAMVFPPPPPEE